MKKKLIIFTVLALAAGGAFFGIVEKLKQDNKAQIEESRQSGDDSEKYKTGETVLIEDVYELAGYTEEPEYLAFQFYKDMGSQETEDIYYIYDKQKIKEIMDTLKGSTLETLNSNVGSLSSESSYNVWIEIDDKSNLMIAASETQNIPSVSFSVVTPVGVNVLSGNEEFEQFDLDHFHGFTWKNQIEEILKDVLMEDIEMLTLEEAKAMISSEDKLFSGYFQQYLHTTVGMKTIGNPEKSALCVRYDLSDYEGYLQVYSCFETEYDKSVLLVELCDKDGKLVETLYESENLGNK